jgi:hypothetical protein
MAEKELFFGTINKKVIEYCTPRFGNGPYIFKII